MKKGRCLMIQAQERVADVVTKHPKTADVFRQYGIDFCCGAKFQLKRLLPKPSV